MRWILLAGMLTLGFSALAERKALQEMSNAELRMHVLAISARSDSPAFIEKSKGSDESEFVLLGSETTVEEVVALEKKYGSSDKERLKREVLKQAQLNLLELRVMERDATRNLKFAEYKQLKAQHPSDYVQRLNKDWKDRERIRFALGIEQPCFGDMEEKIAEMPYDGSHLDGVEFEDYMWDHLTFEFY